MFRQAEGLAYGLEHTVKAELFVELKIEARVQQANNRMGIAEDQAAFEVLRHLLIAVAQMRVLLAHVGLEPGVLIVHPV
jgi:hypothetical protein